VKERAGDRLTGSAHAARRDLEGHANHIEQRCVRFKAAFASHFINGYAARLSRDIRQDDDVSIFEPGLSSSLPSPISIVKVSKPIGSRARWQYTVAANARTRIYIASMANFGNGAATNYRFEQFMGHVRYGTVSHCKVSGWSLRTARIRLRCARLLSRIPLGVQFHDFLLSVAADAAAADVLKLR
jgi:hypothetical protein